ncbi:hypothetical protein RclHR1_03140021 [Rhizophagus clarus]|uniref:BTB domain-containing protein n=1 Tax=Rhizophagus clarus TaxID=94130 RepID=A0A2Z6RAS2_9GLOM|nr:hypothetical protein RclHR1_03140021 [Rhizophagus clarus]GES99205.1 hypothetical protein GLOIN_2v1847655 [Rhizophagus clarus]
MILEFHSSLLKDIFSILDTEDFNIIIRVGEAPDTKKFRAHSNILRACSQYFKEVIPADVIKKDILFTIYESNITPSIFEIILNYFYMGKLDLDDRSGADNFRLLLACDHLLLKELFHFVQYHLIKQHSPWIRQNFALVLNNIFNLPNFIILQDFCINFFCKNPLPLLTSNDFQSLDKYILSYLLYKRDDFHVHIEEVIIWNSLIEWGIKQTPELDNKDQEEWTDIDYENLKDTLSNFVPFIKFLNIISEDFYDKVRPYETIIPNNIYEEIMAYHLVEQPKLCIYNSKIINSRFVNVIVNLIDKNELKYPSIFVRNENNPIYRFKLIYRGSRDGIDNISFGTRCKNDVISLVLIKIRESDKIFVGYNSVGFNLDRNIISIFAYNHRYTDHFILSFKNNEDTQNMKISYGAYSFPEDKFVDQNTLYDSECDSLYIIDQKLYIKHIEGKAASCYRRTERTYRTIANVYTIEEIEAYAVFKPLEG